MLRKRLEKLLKKPVFVVPGDSITLLENGKPLLTDLITRPLTIDKIATADIVNELGFEDGIVGIFGKAEDSKKHVCPEAGGCKSSECDQYS